MFAYFILCVCTVKLGTVIKIYFKLCVDNNSKALKVLFQNTNILSLHFYLKFKISIKVNNKTKC